MIASWLAARDARRFLLSARASGGFDLRGWPPVARRRTRNAGRAVARLRVAQRLMVGFLDPVEDALFLTAGLRGLGVPATFHLGRELVPARPPAGFFAWVRVGEQVVSTSLPVDDEYMEVHGAAHG